jgi:trigger factor
VPKGVGVQVPSSPSVIKLLLGRLTLKIETQARDDHQTKLIAELDAELFDRYMQRAARKISRETRIPGFRPGKAPYEVVRRIAGEQAVQQEAVQLMLDEVYPTALQQANINPSGPGKLEEIVTLDPPTFAFIVPLQPEVTLGDYTTIRKDYAPEPITDEQVDKSLRSLQRSYATSEPVERASEKGDLVSIKLSAAQLQGEEGEPEVLVPEGNYQMVAGEVEEAAQEEWPYPGFNEELIGMTADQIKTVRHTFGEETQFEDLRGKEAEFKIEVQSVKSLTLPELNEEFVQTLGQFESVDGLRTVVRSQLEQNYQQQYDQTYFDELIAELISTANIKYPPHLLDEEIEEFIHGVEHNLEHERLDLDTYLKMRQLDRETFINEEVRPAASRRLERSLVLEEFAKRENVEVKSDEIRSIYFAALQQMEQSSELKKIQSQNKQSTKEMANSLAVNTVNNIYSQRMMARLKAIAIGKGDEPVEEPASAFADMLSEEETVAETEAAPEAEGQVESTQDSVEQVEETTTESQDQPGEEEA